MALTFKNYLEEESKVAYFTFGRMNPPTVGHEKLLDKLSSVAGKDNYFIFLSQSKDKNKNPLDYTSKVKHVRKMFPRHARRVMINKKIKTPFDAATFLFDQGFKSVTMVVGSDRVREFEALLNKYNGEKGRHGFYNFKSINIVSAGSRDPDAEGVEGMSASKLRGFAADNKFSEFSQGIGNLSNKDAKKLFVDVRSGMGIQEESVFTRHIKLEPVSETRERFVRGELFSIGDTVLVKESGEIVTVVHLGSNYVNVVKEDGSNKRMWLDAIQKIEESYVSSAEFIPSPTGGRRSATLNTEEPVAVSKAITQRKKRLKRNSAVDSATAKIKREKQSDKLKHDRILDRARIKDTRTKNKLT